MSGKKSGACACVCEEVGGEKKESQRERERLEVNGEISKREG